MRTSRLLTTALLFGWVLPVLTAATPARATTPTPTTTVISSIQNPSPYGDPVTITALVCAATTPTGMVNFTGALSDSKALVSTTSPASGPCAGQPSAVAQADPPRLTLGIGTYAIMATFPASPSFASSNDTLFQTVEKADSSTSMFAASPTPAYPSSAQPVVTVCSRSGGAFPPVPTGRVTFTEGSTSLDVDVLFNAGVPRGCATTYGLLSLTPGSHTITATYSGDGEFRPSTATAVQAVDKGTTSTDLHFSPASTVYGQDVDITTEVCPSPAAITMAVPPSGALTISDNGTPMITSGVGAGTAPCAQLVLETSLLAVGTHTIAATYAGDDNYNGSAATTSYQVTGKGVTTSSISTSKTPTVFGEPDTLTATVCPVAPSFLRPDGTVQFADAGTVIASAALSPNIQGFCSTAAATVTSLALGSHSIAANFVGTEGYGPSSGTLTQLVNKADTIVTITASANPSVYGQPVTYTETVCAAWPSSGPASPPSGQVSTTANPVPLALTPGGGSQCAQAASTPSPVDVGTLTVSAQYLGDANFNASPISAGLVETINQASTASTVSGRPNPSTYKSQVELLARACPVTPSAAGRYPRGTFTFKDGPTVLNSSTAFALGGSDPCIYGVFGTSSLIPGTHQITATYSGDSDFVGSTSPPYAQVVQCATTISGAAGSVTLSNGACLSGATVGGNVTIASGATAFIVNSTVHGNVLATNAGQIGICASHVDGNVHVTGTSGFTLVGGDGLGGCAGNVIGGNTTLSSTHGGLRVAANTIKGSTGVTNNNASGTDLVTNAPAATVVSRNVISSTLQCSGNAPTASNGGAPNTVNGTRTGECSGTF